MPEHFSTRWGIPILDRGERGGQYLFGWMLRNYAEAGLTRNEFLCILHLSAYKYETPHGSAHPSLVTIAEQMGYSSDRQVRRLVASLVDKGLLVVEERPGQTNVYNFELLAQKLTALDLERHPDEETPIYGPTEEDEDTPVKNDKGDKNDIPTPVKNDKSTPVKNDIPPLSKMSTEEKETAKRKQDERSGRKKSPRLPQPVIALCRATNHPYPKEDDEIELLMHPATAAWLTTTGRVEPWDTYRAIVEVLGDEPDLGALAWAWREWRLHGYRQHNIRGILNWYGQRVAEPTWSPDRGKSGYNGSNGQSETPEQLDEFTAYLEQQAQERAELQARRGW